MPTIDETMVELVKRCSDDDADARNDLVERFAGLVRYAVRTVLPSNPADIDDAAQIAWMRIFSALGRWEGRASLATYLRSIAVRAAIDFRRGKSQALEFAALECDVPSPVDEAISEEDRQRLQVAVSELEPRLRRHVELWLAKMPNREIAIELQQPLRTVQWQFKHIILEELRRRL